MSGPYITTQRMTSQQLAELDPDKLFIQFGPVAVGGRQLEWIEICNRVKRLWVIEHSNPPAKAESELKGD